MLERYEITYTHKTFNGNDITKTIIADTKEQAETICKNIEALVDEGYRLNDITRCID